MRFTTVIAVIILIMGIFGLFQIKFQVQNLRKDLVEVKRQLIQENEAIHVLKAEWTHLNQPERITNLAQKYLQLDAIKIAQIKKMDKNLPLFLAEDEVKRHQYITAANLKKELVTPSYKDETVQAVSYDKKDDVPAITEVKF